MKVCWIFAVFLEGRGVGRDRDGRRGLVEISNTITNLGTLGNCEGKLTYGRGVGRIPEKTPCPNGLRDDVISCWSDAHVYGKGCCCTIFKDCCQTCKAGYHDSGCLCCKIDWGIKVTLDQRFQCGADEELSGWLCYPKCKEGYRPFGCCLCVPDCAPIWSG